MPDERRHRGPHPDDPVLFGPGRHGDLRSATADLSWLLSRGYAMPSGLKIVGDRYGLTERQRRAVMRSAASDEAVVARRGKEVRAEEVAARAVWVDGYNVLTTVEAALGGGVIIGGRDGCYRDIASMHGTFRTVEETRPALALCGEELARLGVGEVVWFLDAPVSNSGRLKGIMGEVAGERGWRVEVVMSPDAVLASTSEVVTTADSAVLDRCAGWVNLARAVVRERVMGAWVVEMA